VVKFNYYGTGQVKVVAIHGLGSASTAWRPLIPNLPKEFTLITLDLPGHGASIETASPAFSPEVLAEMIRDQLLAESIEKFHLMGNSLGGWIALEMAAKFPENVLSVTGVAPAGLWLNPKKHLNLSLSISRVLARLTLKFADHLLKIKLMRFIGFGMVSPQWQKLSIETCTDAAQAMGGASGYVQIWEGTLGKRFDKDISAKIPISIIFGDSDKTLPAKNCQERSLLPSHHEWFIFDKSGHAPMWDNTEGVARILKATVAKSISN
jgi:pimeloyl-ACP methyl ester carboxylesterase